MKKTKQATSKRTLKLGRETLRTLTGAQMNQMEGGTSFTIPPLPTGTCAGSNNSCRLCQEN
jgi:hypothetical protein